MQHVPDPYRVLGVQRSATLPQIKAAHRGMAKRFHPDAAEADTGRFLAVQEAYSILSDPLRRRDWDARHEPGPVRAGEGTSRGRAKGAAGRWTREDTDVAARRGARPPRRGPAGESGPTRPPGPTGAPGRGPGQRSSGYGAPDDAPHDPDEPRQGPDRWSASGRDPSTRSYTWTAEGVPWWEDPPGTRRRSNAPDDPRAATPSTGPARGAPSGDTDVYSRSSGAAWSSAARRYFRQGDSDLPSRGVFRRQGTQYVTGARARESADAEARRRPARPADAMPSAPADQTHAQDARGGQGAGDGALNRPGEGRAERGSVANEGVLRPRPGPAGPRQAFDHGPTVATQAGLDRTAAVVPPSAARQGGLRTDRQLGVRRGGIRSPAPLAPTLVRRVAELSLAWLPVAAGIGYGAPAAIGCSALDGSCPADLPSLQAIVAVLALALFVASPGLARIGAIATSAALSVAGPLFLAGALLGLLPPARPIALGAISLVGLIYLGTAATATGVQLRRSMQSRRSGP